MCGKSNPKLSTSHGCIIKFSFSYFSQRSRFLQPSKYTKLMTSKLANALPKIATSLNPQSYSSASSVQLISKKSSLTLTHPIPRFKYYALHTSYIFSVRDENFIKLLVQKTLCSSKKRSPPEKHKNQTHKLNKSKSFAFVYKNFSWFSIFSKKSFEFILRDVCR